MDTFHGWAAVRLAAPRTLASFAIALAAICTGCKTDPLDPFVTLEDSMPRAGSIYGDTEFATRPLEPELLENHAWFEKPTPSYAERTADDRRWRHPSLDAYLHPSAPRRELKEELQSTSPVVATNAAIMTAHWKSGAPIDHLVAAVRAEPLPLPLRSAAAEALGRVEKPSPAPEIRKLLNELAMRERHERSPDADSHSHKNPVLQADLIRSLARHAEPGDEKWFSAAITSSDWQLRLEGVAAWSALPELSLPKQVIETRNDSDPRVRAMAVRTIAAHRGPRTVTYLQQALEDQDFDVRTAAMTALGNIGTADAKALLEGMKQRGADLQDSALAAFDSARELGNDVQAAANDTQMQLRLAAAQRLEQAERRGQQVVDRATASTQQAVRQASAQFETVADNVDQRINEVQQLVESLRAADLPDVARQEAATALERMAMDANLAVRVQAAEAMGELADPAYLPVLMAMLSDEGDVQLAAMASLVAIAGTDVAAHDGAQPLSTQDKVRMWQVWYRDRQNAPH